VLLKQQFLARCHFPMDGEGAMASRPENVEDIEFGRAFLKGNRIAAGNVKGSTTSSPRWVKQLENCGCDTLCLGMVFARLAAACAPALALCGRWLLGSRSSRFSDSFVTMDTVEQSITAL
jgi:hypothetical protein